MLIKDRLVRLGVSFAWKQANRTKIGTPSNNNNNNNFIVSIVKTELEQYYKKLIIICDTGCLE